MSEAILPRASAQTCFNRRLTPRNYCQGNSKNSVRPPQATYKLFNAKQPLWNRISQPNASHCEHFETTVPIYSFESRDMVDFLGLPRKNFDFLSVQSGSFGAVGFLVDIRTLGQGTEAPAALHVHRRWPPECPLARLVPTNVAHRKGPTDSRLRTQIELSLRPVRTEKVTEPAHFVLHIRYS